jgi:hypothetical protein
MLIILMLTVLYISRCRTEVRYQTKGNGTDQSEAQEGNSSEKRVNSCPRSKENANQGLEIAF